jgi:hypothetical protein
MRGPIDPEEMRAFFASFFYDEAAFLVDEVVRVDGERHEIEARLDTTRVLPTARHQRVSQVHPAHVSGPDLLMVTACLGSLHAWFFHGVRWDEGWVGYGSRIHWAEFRHLAHAGPALDLLSRETAARADARRLVIGYAFDFRQAGRSVYRSEQTALFLKDRHP